MRIVNLCIPYPCGVYQVHVRLKSYFERHGSTLTWLGSGSENAEKVRLHGTDDDRDGAVVACETEDGAGRTRALVDYVRQTRPDALMFNVWGDDVDTNAARYMPGAIPRVVIVHSNALAAYRAVRSVRDYVDAAVATSRRIAEDLNCHYGYARDRIRYIPNGVDLSAYGVRVPWPENGILRILSHGRVDSSSKGIFWLAGILSKVSESTRDWELTLSGDGPDLAELKERFARAGLLERVRFRGWTAPAEVPALMQAHDMLLFPSTFEGFPLTIIEAMAGGCVPIASKLAGITDSVIEHGKSGFLFPVGDVKLAARYVLELASNRERLAALSTGAVAAASNYSVASQGAQYEALIRESIGRPHIDFVEEPLDRWHLDKGLRPAWWYGLPEPVKNRLRIAREKLRAFAKVP
ncbi:MAG: glycosyltransferase family 4 protein [Bryobacteraceae bacterium]